MTLQIFKSPEQVLDGVPRGIALGFFDGIHRGHQDLIRTLVYTCQQHDLRPSVYTFADHPDLLLHDRQDFAGYLTPISERMELLSGYGVEEVICADFTPALAALPPLAFLADQLLKGLHVKLIVVGADYRFGHQGQGDISLLEVWCRQYQVELIVMPDVRLLGSRISSSRIRDLIRQGDMQQADSCLGRPFFIRGAVIHGRKLGRTLGFPTANLLVPTHCVMPTYGVYATRTRVGRQIYASITSLGIRPTITDQTPVPIVETFLYDTGLDLYGQTIEVQFLEFLRPEMKFESILQLSTQVSDDLEKIRKWHQANEQIYIRTVRNNIPVWVLRTRRFAQASIQLVFQRRLKTRENSAMALLIRLLVTSCRRYPSRYQLAAALDSLYGAAADSRTEKYGDVQSLFLTADALMNWTDGSSPFRQVIPLLFDLLVDPLPAADGPFDEVTFESEKRSLIMEIVAHENDRTQYAYDRCMSLLCQDAPHGLKTDGDIAGLEALTLPDIRQAYTVLLQETPLSIYVGGALDDETMQLILSQIDRLPAGNRPAAGYLQPTAFRRGQPGCPGLVVENKVVEQTRLCLAYEGLPPYFSHRTIVASLLNSMLGGDVHSLLFDVVREQMGLAYSVFSMSSRFIGTMLMIAGVASEQSTAAMEAMQQQVEVLAQGHFNSRLMETARKMLSASLRSIQDDLGNMLANQVAMVATGRLMSLADSLSMLDAVTREDIMALAADLQPCVLYKLAPIGGEAQ